MEIPTLVLTTDYILPIAGSLITGGMIGYEREYRGRAAGLRTHMLMCLSSTLLMMAAAHQFDWFTHAPADSIRADPMRMAHGVMTGIGFLCGGVIFRQGLSVHGLTTAASLWTTAALGVLYGIGSYGIAVTGALVTLFVLALLRGMDKFLPKLEVVDATISYHRAEAPTPAEIQAYVHDLGFTCSATQTRLTADEIAFTLALKNSRRHGADALVARLRADPKVIGFDVDPRKD
jgi:putative Mg2+ transporter-C (MgtC) family protein